LKGSGDPSKIWTGKTLVGPASNSGDHHHAETEVRLETRPGDFVFVPPYVPHREENPGDTAVDRP
jgi:oxalate decarboxylase/phosphoglucose isomerase-like protein (cupin superfamily)